MSQEYYYERGGELYVRHPNGREVRVATAEDHRQMRILYLMGLPVEECGAVH